MDTDLRHRAATLLGLLCVPCALALGCAHAPLAPRLIVAGRLTMRASGGTEAVAAATVEVPVDGDRPQLSPPSRPPAIIPVDVADLGARYGEEPTVDELVARALEGPLLDPRRASDARDRARLSGLLPIVRADVRRGSGWDLRTSQGVTADTAVLASDDSWSVVGSLTFRLDRLIFAREETMLLSEERRLEEARLRLISEIVQAYFERRRLQLERDRRGATDLAIEVRIAELGAMLDLLTGGGLSGARPPS